MPGALGPRFLIEAGFIIAVAVVAGVERFRTLTIVVVVGSAWLAVAAVELALELAHNYLHPIQVDRNVGLLAAVGEGMQGRAGLAGRIFTAISRERVNIIAIAQGSNEMTIAIVVRRAGLEKAVRAVHAECHMG